MRTDYAALALIVDRSGSMYRTANDAKGSVKNFIEEQKKFPGQASLTLVQFDDICETVYDFNNIKEVYADKFVNQYQPRGNTALLDAIGRTTIAMKQKIDAMPPEEKPSRIVVAVVTDGEENASREYTYNTIKEMIAKNEALGWDFMFMGSTLNAITVANNIGFSKNKSAFYSNANLSSCINLINEKVFQARLGKEVDILDSERANLAGNEKPQR